MMTIVPTPNPNMVPPQKIVWENILVADKFVANGNPNLDEFINLAELGRSMLRPYTWSDYIAAAEDSIGST
jgi:hypothetical protein